MTCRKFEALGGVKAAPGVGAGTCVAGADAGDVAVGVVVVQVVG